MAHPDVPAEQAHVDHAYERLAAMRAAAESMLHDAFGERGGTFQALAERDIRVRNSLSRLEHLQIGGEGLVFGRIDREPEPGAERAEEFHIGRLAISDTDQEPLVVDWRAPVAEPFYRATGAVPMGLTRRRHFLTHARRVVDLEDEFFDAEGAADGRNLGLSGAQVLLAALERSRTGRMRDIVATVQREQDQVIRAPLAGVLIVQGGPGTGKTAVALHRAAYLLYTHRFPLERQGVLVVGPNALFLRYIGQVLPSLGETGVELSTVTGLFGDVSPTATERPEIARLKGDSRMARVLARAIGDRQRPLRRAVRVPFGRLELQITPEMSADVVGAAKRRPGTHNSRRRAVENLLWNHLAEQLERRALPTSAGEANDPAPAVSHQDLGRQLRRVPEVAEALDRMWPVLRASELLHDLFGSTALLDLAGRPILDEAERRALYRPRGLSLDGVAWTVADMALLDEARALLGAPRRRAEPGDDPRSFGHIVVDEAQDLSPMELRMLTRRSLSGSMTVVGDIAQGTTGWAPSSWDQIVRHLPVRRGWRQVELTVNYRTPAEIMSVAARVLEAATPGMVPPEAIRSSGEQPRILRSAPGTLADGLASLVSETVAGELVAVTDAGGVEGTVGVIAPPSLVQAIALALGAAGLPSGLVGDGALDAVVSVLAVDDAKGLEFDALIVVEPALLVEQACQGLRALYVALTRSIRRLAIVHSAPLPEVLLAGVRASVQASQS
jgi:DNA helicase IV